MKGECGAFSRLALDRHVPVMFGHHVADVVQSEAEAFHVMQVAVGHAVELVEYPLLVGFADADPFVCDREGRFLRRYRPFEGDSAGFLSGIFDCITDQIAEHVIQMGTVGRYGHMFRYLCRNLDRFV